MIEVIEVRSKLADDSKMASKWWVLPLHANLPPEDGCLRGCGSRKSPVCRETIIHLLLELQVEQSDLWMKIGQTISQQSWFEFDAINIRYDMTAEKNDKRVPELEQGAASLLQCHAASR